jgi:uncharacterized 2Fe-2S/4Fe-4S cluster protein (DUF4445 family)
MMFNVKIVLRQQTIKVSLNGPVRLSKLLRENGIPFDMPCGGKGRCRKCKVKAYGSFSKLTQAERSVLSDKEIADGLRFACMTDVTGDAEISIIDYAENQKIVSKGLLPAFSKKPIGKKIGVAVDIGTTTVAAYLYELKTHNLLASSFAANPQKLFGADVISRIENAMAGDADRLSQCIVGCVEKLSKEMCQKSGVAVSDVDAIVITGNTAMLYLLTRNDVECLSRAPFIASTLFGSYGFSFSSFPDAAVYLPRCISAYVGADITMGVLSSGMTDSDDCSLLVDIGTNGEMALQYSGKLLCCSTAAGPAFEGVGIYMGMNASKGAIDHVFMQEGKIRCSTVDNATACGICGSGIIDAVAVLLENGIIDKTGAFMTEGNDFTASVVPIDGEPAYRFDNSDVVITQKDIREIQLAKSAICAGLKTLLNNVGVEPDAVEKFYLAGGFGSFINTDSAAAIGLFPAKLKKKAVVLGNAAGMGACMALLSSDMLDKSVKIAERARTVELSTSRFFMDSYIDGMMF